MIKFLLWIALVGTTSLSFGQPGKDLVDSVFSLGFSGVVLVAEKGKPVFYKANGYRRFETKTPLQKTDVFEFASVSKQFTAMVIMMLKEAGKLEFDDPVSKYLDIPYPGICIRHLLTHTSGLPDYQAIMDAYWDKTKVAGNPDIIFYLNKYAPPKRFEPGEKYEYSNTGYVLLASIAEKASREDFIAFIRKRIFKPLKMKNTDIRTLEEKSAVKHFAAGHLLDSTGQFVNANRFHASDYTIWLGNRKGPGRVSGTATDLLKWDKALYTQKLVGQKTLEEAFSPMTLNDGSISPYGFGWDLGRSVTRGRVVSHSGDNPGYKTIIVRQLDNRKTIIILNNNAHPTMRLLVDKSVWVE